mmetsp:Transcript_94279/g.167657  ORF Transcript_94279/g.167657 Transcript_94279/m.167657 type:complete len:252 (+) Transcript_94279:232-987(+)
MACRTLVRRPRRQKKDTLSLGPHLADASSRSLIQLAAFLVLCLSTLPLTCHHRFSDRRKPLTASSAFLSSRWSRALGTSSPPSAAQLPPRLPHPRLLPQLLPLLQLRQRLSWPVSVVCAAAVAAAKASKTGAGSLRASLRRLLCPPFPHPSRLPRLPRPSLLSPCLGLSVSCALSPAFAVPTSPPLRPSVAAEILAVASRDPRAAFVSASPASPRLFLPLQTLLLLFWPSPLPLFWPVSLPLFWPFHLLLF